MIALLRGSAAAALVAVAALAVAAPAPAPAAPAASAAELDRVVFTGTFVRPSTPAEVDGVEVNRYQVEVAQVFGPVDVRRRATVESPVLIEQCQTRRGGVGQAPSGQGQAGQGQAGQGQAGQGQAGQSGAQQEQSQPDGTATEPTSPETTPPATTDRRVRVFRATVDGDRYVVRGCVDVALATDQVLTDIIGTYGEARAPGITEQSDDSPQGDDVGFLCPDTRDAVDLDTPDACDALAEGDGFDRAAAPGLALVIVGALGLLLARRLGRPSR